jgi:hypothetical protein
MDSSIAELYAKGYIDREEAVLRSANPAKLDKLIRLAEQYEVS